MLPIIPLGRPFVLVRSDGSRCERARMEGYAEAVRDMERAKLVEESKAKESKSKTKTAPKEEKGKFTKYIDAKKKYEDYGAYFRKKEEEAAKPKDSLAKYQQWKAEEQARQQESDFAKYMGYKQKHEEYGAKLRGGAEQDRYWDDKTRYPSRAEQSYAEYNQYRDSKRYGEHWRQDSVDWSRSRPNLERGPSRYYFGDGRDVYPSHGYGERAEYRPRQEMQERRPRGYADSEMAFPQGRPYR